MLNVAAAETNPVWDNGEGFGSLDATGTAIVPNHGGFHDDDHLAALGIGDVHSFYGTASPPLGWHRYNPSTQSINAPDATVWRFLGYLRPRDLGPYPSSQSVADAAFEVFAPLDYDPQAATVVVLVMWPTWGTPPAVVKRTPDRFAYPGYLRADGLVGDANGFGRPESVLLDLTQSPERAGNPDGMQAITAYIVPRLFPRSLVFQMQRYQQLSKAIGLMFQQSPTGPNAIYQIPGEAPPPVEWPRMLVGGSFGGFTAQLGVLRYPDMFHGASARAFSASMRRTVGEQWFWNFVGRRTGMGFDETSFVLLDTLDWSTWLRQIGWDYFNASTIVRRRLQLQVRPLQLLVADEDTVTCGVDWLPLIHGQRGYVARGIAPALFGSGPGRSEPVDWAIVDRRCHAEGGWFQTARMGAPSLAISEAERSYLPAVYQHWQNTLGQTFGTVPTFVADSSEDPYDPLLARGVAPAPPANALLKLDTAFGVGGRTEGHGLTLGADESLTVADIDGTPFVYAGDADGIVHRFAYDPASQSFHEVARSPSLGYGAWALAVGEVQAGSRVVVVGTLRHLYQLDATTLAVLSSHALEFEYERPRRLKIAEVHAGSPGREILLTTFHGHLLCYDGNFGLRTDLAEPGIEDFVVHEGQDYGPLCETTSPVPITLLSHRGHLINVTLNDDPANPNADPARLHCWSPGEQGWPLDLEAYASAGGAPRVVAGYQLSDDAALDPIQEFDGLTLQPVRSYGSVDGTRIQAGGNDGDLEIVANLEGDPRFVFRSGNQLSRVLATGAAQLSNDLGLHSPSFTALAVRVVDIDPNLPGLECILSTRCGRIVMVRESELANNWFVNPPPRPSVAPASPPYVRTNASLAGTWGMLSREIYVHEQEIPFHKIFAATQDGQLFEVDPVTGSQSLLVDMRNRLEANAGTGPNDGFASLPVSPVRDLVYVGENVSSVATAAQTPRLRGNTVPGRPGWWLATEVWQNRSSAFDQPDWYHRPPIDGSTGNYAEGYEPPVQVPVYAGFVPLSGSGDVGGWTDDDTYTGTRDVQLWGGSGGVYPNLVHGVQFDDLQVLGHWGSTRNDQPQHFGRSKEQCKDLRNMIRDPSGSTYSLQSLRRTRDQGGRLIVASTAGGGLVLLRPSEEIATHGEIEWSSEDAGAEPLDDGFGGMALAVRRIPGGTNTGVDIFFSPQLGYPDPAAPPGQAAIGATVRWLRWSGPSMQQMGPAVQLDAIVAASGRRVLAVAGLAVGDVLDGPGHPGDELVVTTLDGDLLVFSIAGGVLAPAPLLHTWVPAALGANNAILIADLDPVPGNELYVGSSQGIYKWVRQ